MKLTRRVYIAAALAAASLTTPGVAQAATVPAGFEDVLVEDGVSGGTSLQFAPDGRMFFNEGGRVFVREPDSVAPRQIYDVPGFPFSVALDTDFTSNGQLYVGYVFGEQGAQNLRVTRITLRSDYSVAATKVILGSHTGPCPAPDNTLDCMQLPAPENHAIGSIVSDPRDGTLWISNGDNASPGGVDPLAYHVQDPNSLQGKMLHVDREGRGLPGHAYCPEDADLSHNCTKVHAVGMRNAYRFNLRPSDGLPVTGDVGWESREEVNVVRKGRNYGWPCYEGSTRTTGYRESATCQSLYSREGTSDGAVPPVYEYARTEGRSVIGGPAVVDGSWPADFQGDIIIGDYVNGWLKRLKLDSQDRVVSVLPFATGWGAGVDLKFGPGGDLYYLHFADQGEIRKIRYVGGGNRTPVAVATAGATSGSVPLTVQFSGARSSDPDGDALVYDWDFGDGSPHSKMADPIHTYTAAGTYVATLTVTDGRGGRSVQDVTIRAGNTDPELTVSAPATFRAGEPVAVVAEARDAEDGPLPPSSVRTTVILRHDTHDHPMTSATSGGVTSFTPVRDHDADSHYVATVRATDSGGAETVKTVAIRPQTAGVRISANVPGPVVSYGGSSFASPFEHASTVGFHTTISVPETVVSGGRTYVFEAWSDGRPRQHEVTVPAGGLSLAVTYRPQTQGTQPQPEPGAQPQPGADDRPVGPPRLTGLRVSRTKFPLSARAQVRYRLSATARVEFAFRRLSGSRGTRAKTVVRVTRKARTGLNTLTFRRRIGGKVLRTGRYEVVARVRGADAGGAAPRSVRFRLTR